MDHTPAARELTTLLGSAPVVDLPWREVRKTDFDRVALRGQRLLYAVHRDQELLYLGKSQDLRLRLGYLAGGLASGDERLHAGGARLRAMGVDPAELRVAVYLGDALYRRHYHLVRELRPPGNRESRIRQGTSLPA